MFKNEMLIEETDRLRKFAFRLAGNYSDAEDLVQSALLRAMEKKHLFKEGTNLYSWVSKIMFNLFVSKYRRRTKFETQYDPEPYLEQQATLAAQEEKIHWQDVRKAMEALTDEHRQILVMVCVKSMRYAEVSEKLAIPVGTVRSRLSRAREALQRALLSTDNVLAFEVPGNDSLEAEAARGAARGAARSNMAGQTAGVAA